MKNQTYTRTVKIKCPNCGQLGILDHFGAVRHKVEWTPRVSKKFPFTVKNAWTYRPCQVKPNKQEN